ncbi:MAG: exosortase-associated protein EpsI, B-type [Pseudomonadota bacterium]
MTTATLPIFNFRNLAIGVAMLVSAGLALVLTPKQMAEADRPKIDLEAMIPQAFGDWQVDGSITPVQVAPDVQAKLDKIYSQTLSRTYVNGNGERVMLSIAYGGDQSDSMQAHRPEVCYPAQGFQVVRQVSGSLSTRFGTISVKRLVAAHGKRIEPITYWFVTGGRVNVDSLERKMAQLRFGLTGQIPDGLLFRISSIASDTEGAFSSQTRFVEALLQSVDDQGRARLIGQLGG